MNNLTESEIRALRDRVYGHPTSDKNWEGCRENWLRPESTQWLIDRVGTSRCDVRPSSVPPLFNS